MTESSTHFHARKTEGAETWEVVSPSGEVVDFGLTEEVAKNRAEVANEMDKEIHEGGDD